MERTQAQPVSRYLAAFYPEARFGGFSGIDGTVAFYTCINALPEPDYVVVGFGCRLGTC